MKNIYFNEYNVLLEGTVYLPIVSGMLQSYAIRSPEIRDHYSFQPFVYRRNRVDALVAGQPDPDVACFSVYMWNEQLSLRVAAELKRLYPRCLIIFGGPQVPNGADDYFQSHSFIDIVVRGEGELVLAEILKRNLTRRDFIDIPGVSWRDGARRAIVHNQAVQPFPEDLDTFPSPYLEGIFEALIRDNPRLEFQAIIESNRGCPYKCTYCCWGQGTGKKFRFHSLERVRAEIEWCARHKIQYVFSADSNFGMHARDLEIARMLVEAKRQYQYPEKFRCCFAKSGADRIFNIALLLVENNLDKGVTLALQSNNPQVLKNVHRQNIGLSLFKKLLTKCNAAGVPVYTEMILGLPGESYSSWVEGTETILASDFKGQIYTYLCEVYPNTRMADPHYQAQFGIVTKRIELTEIHGLLRPNDLEREYQDVIVATQAMSVDDFRRMQIFSWLTMALHSLKLGFFLLKYLKDRYAIAAIDFPGYLAASPALFGKGLIQEELREYNRHLDRVLTGHGRGVHLPDFGAIYWDMEEASYLRWSSQLDAVYDEIFLHLKYFLEQRGKIVMKEELREVVRYQQARIPLCNAPAHRQLEFRFNLPQYFDESRPAEQLIERKQVLVVHGKDFCGCPVDYAREVVLRGRRHNKLLNEADWDNI